MTTTQNYNPLLRAFRELTTPDAFRWYHAQAKATATLASTIAHHSFTTAQRLLSDRHGFAKAPHQEFAPTIAPAVQDDGEAVEGLENAIAPQQESASAEASEPKESPVSDDWEAIEAVDTEQAEPEQADAGWEAIAPSEADIIAPAIAPELELNDSESDHLAIAELEQAIAPHQEYAQAEAIAPEPDFGDAESLCEAIAGDGEADAEDITKLRYWAELELPSILDEEYLPLEDDAEADD